MKTAHKIILSLFIIFFFRFAHPVQSYASRYGEALLTINIENWDSNRIKMPSVIYDKSIYKMLYSGLNINGRWQIGLAYSLDGINWIKFIEPIKSRLLFDNRDVHDPTWLFNPISDLYEMWYASSTNGGVADLKIYHSESVDGIHWSNDNDIIVHNPEASWERDMVSCPNVLFVNNQYYMWIAGRSSGVWKIGLFTSNNGHDWIAESKNPVLLPTYSAEFTHLISPEVYYDIHAIERKFNMFYSSHDLGAQSAILYAYSNDGVSWIKPISENPVVIKSSISNSFDQYGVSESSVIKTSNSTLIWYGGSYLGSKGIGLAFLGSVPTPLPTPIEPFFPTVTPTSTPSPTPVPTSTPIPATPTPIHTPTPTPLKPIVIIPGMFASWNKEEILENKHTNSPWKLLNFVKEYDGLIQTLKNLGYVENTNLFIWFYDWRQPISDLSTQLDTYLSNNIFSIPEVDTINIVGHSLGGLVARAWTQSGNNKSKINNLITLGSPHQGVIQPYLAWEGGDITYGNSLLSFTTQLLLQINRKRFQSNRETIQHAFPVLKDLLPPSSYLIRKSDNSEVTKNQMFVWNNWLETLNTAVGSIYPLFDAIIGNSSNTPHKYVVTQPNKIDFLLGNWQDGKPIHTIDELGDGTVTQLRSGFIDDPNYVLNKNHGELIASKEGITKILDILNLDYTSNAIIEGKSTTFAPGLLFLLESPATILVKHNDKEYRDIDGILFIPDAQDGTYTTTITGTGNGDYHLSIGQFSTNKTVWSSITKPIHLNEQHTYVISYDAINPEGQPITNMTTGDWLDQIENNLSILSTYINEQTLRRLRIEVALIRKMLSKQQYFIVKVQIELLLRSLSKIRHTSSNEAIHVVDDIEHILDQLYVSLFQNKPPFFPEKSLNTQKNMLDKELSQIIKTVDSGTAFSSQELLFIQRGIETFEVGKANLLNNQLAEATFQFILAHYLFQIH